MTYARQCRSILRLSTALLALTLLGSCETIRQTSTGTEGWCDIMAAWGGVVSLSRSDVLTPETHRHLLKINQYGIDHCNWKR